MRNHYAHEKNPQEFYLFEEPYKSGMRNSLRQRYSLIKFIYTLLFEAAVNGKPVVRHPMFDYPAEDSIVKNEDSFMLGTSVRITANFDTKTEPGDFRSSFGQGIWVDYNTYQTILVQQKSEVITLYNGWEYTNVHIKGGSIIPSQVTGEGSGIKTTSDLLNIPLNLIIVPCKSGYAEGTLFLAKGELIEEPYQYFKISHANKVIQFVFEGDDSIDERVQEIHIVGDEAVLESDYVSALDIDSNPITLKIEKAEHKSGNSFLNITSEDGNGIQMSKIQSISYGKAIIDSKSYVAVKKEETQFEIKFELSHKITENDSVKLILTTKLLSDNTIQVKISDDSGKRFEVPKEALNQSIKARDITKNITDFILVTDDPFTLTVHEFQQPKNIYLLIDDNSLVLKEYFLSLKTLINTNGQLYGIGERIKEFLIPEGIYTTWSRDIPDPYDDGKKPGKNIYGTHPVYFTRSKSGNKLHWGMLNLNANAQDTEIKYTGKLGGEISHYITGQGIFDLYFFVDHQTPESAVKEYHNLIGYPLLPPFYALGWNQCRYGYTSTQELAEVVKNYTNSGFPLDSLWSDIDYMYKYRDFTYDKEGKYEGLDVFIKETLHKNNKYYVPIIDAGMAVVQDDSYPAFDRGLKENAYILSGNSDKNEGIEKVFFGKVWPGYAAYPDFTSEKANNWWISELNSFHAELEFDGLWLDMNEASNFCSGACLDKDKVPMEDSIISQLTYIPGVNNLEDKSISLDAKHSDGHIELNHHSLFGFMQGVTSSKYFTDNNKRPFIISRSTFVGQGKYTSHWLGDNFSEFKYLKYSIAGIYNMNLFGMNFVGPDI